MKKVIFICLLSISACLSAPTVDESKSSPPQAPNTLVTDKNQTQPKPSEPATETQPDNHTPGQTTPQTNATNQTIPTTQQAQNNTATPTSNETKINNTTPANDNKTDKTTEKKTDTPKDTNVKDATETKDNADKVTPLVKPEEHKDKKNETSTQKSEVTTTNTNSEAKKADTEKDDVVLQSRGFDGPSFIGGIILALGLIAIGIMGFKYYKAHNEDNYRTL